MRVSSFLNTTVSLPRTTKKRFHIFISLVFFIAFGLSAHAVTRGADGDLVMFLWLFSGLGLAYVVVRSIPIHPPTILFRLAELVAIEIAIFLGMFYLASLDEMGAMLYFGPPIGFAFAFFVSLIVSLIARLSYQKSKTGPTPS